MGKVYVARVGGYVGIKGAKEDKCVQCGLLNSPGYLIADPGLEGVLSATGARPDSEVDCGGELIRTSVGTLAVDTVLRWR